MGWRAGVVRGRLRLHACPLKNSMRHTCIEEWLRPRCRYVGAWLAHFGAGGALAYSAMCSELDPREPAVLAWALISRSTQKSKEVCAFYVYEHGEHHQYAIRTLPLRIRMYLAGGPLPVGWTGSGPTVPCISFVVGLERMLCPGPRS